ncbi:Uncharacterised protein [Mycobacteroides abscessus subsp. massiliense]|nr:Uncharacterised protein [Mycobacteroides abscessus subsp. massiliense]
MRDDRRVHGPSGRGVLRERQFFAHHRRESEITAGTTVFLRKVQAQQTRIAHLVPELTVHLMLGAPTFLVGCGFLAQEFGGMLTQVAVRVGLPGRTIGREQFGHYFTPFRGISASAAMASSSAMVLPENAVRRLSGQRITAGRFDLGHRGSESASRAHAAGPGRLIARDTTFTPVRGSTSKTSSSIRYKRIV